MLEFSHGESMLFAFDNAKNILLEKDMAIKNSRMTVGALHGSVLRMEGLWAPPYVSSNFIFDIRLFGEKVKADSFRWFPFALERTGSVEGLEVSSLFAFGRDMRTIVICAELGNRQAEDRAVPLQANIQGGIDYLHMWEFSTAVGTKEADLSVDAHHLVKKNNDKAIIVTSSVALRWFAPASLWEGVVTVPAGGTVRCWFTVSLGSDAETAMESSRTSRDPQAAVDEAVRGYEQDVQSLLSRVPRLESDDKRLERFYYRSLVHYLTNCWEVDEFVLNPYYSTGGMRGGCVGSYLWDFSAGWQIHAIADPDTTKRQIMQFLRLDLSKCFAFNPVDGCAFGPWYPVNHEKIIGLIYYYVRNTGDTAFLSETVGGKTVCEWAVHHAMMKDDLNGPVELTDYGVDGEHHLELRRGIPYHGVLPDLNGRRYMNYVRAYELTCIEGHPLPMLLERAVQLKDVLKKHLWNSEDCWYDFIAGGKRETRHTIQMFKLFSSPVLGREEEEGLLSHLNDGEFLSDFGIHSMSKLDDAYDQVDIDNGGGGACSIFAPLIAEKLYRAGRGEYADSILRRVLWWGERVPYWGDSFVANYMDYRQDTPLQCTIGGVAGAQCILFGMFGVDAEPGGAVTVNPHLPGFCKNIGISGLRIHGKTIDIAVRDGEFVVSVNGVPARSKLGTPIIV